MFLGDELSSFLQEMKEHLEAIPSESSSSATLLVAASDENAPAMGAAYYTPEIMAQGVMNLLFIGVDPSARRQGFGAALLSEFEDAAAASKSRLAIIETASDEMFSPAWALYRSHGYDEEARVRDFFDEGLDKLVFRKRL